MEGFFTKKETESITRPDGKTYSCVSCGLIKGSKTPKMTVSGNFKKGILNIGSIPSRIEDNRGKPFQNKSAKLLEKLYKQVGIDLHEDCLNTYSVNCFSVNNPTIYQMDCCRKSILKLIKKHKPKIIVLFGDYPLYSIIGNRWKKDLGKIEKWRGFTIPDQELKTWVCPVFDPDYVLNAKNNVEEVIFAQDLKKISELISIPFKEYKKPKIMNLKENELYILDSIKNKDIVFDYEGTGLKPQAKGQRIVCASVAVDEDNVFTFMIPKNRIAKKPFIELMKRKSVGKIAQNIKYEDTWTNVRLRTKVRNWVWDTMIASHVIDNRKGTTGLKFQTYVQFGIIDYDSEVTPYLRAKEENNANAINQIHKLLKKPGGKKLLLKYCAFDSINTYRLAKLQQKIITRKQPKGSKYGANIVDAYNLLHNGILALARAERQGLRIDVEYAKKKKLKLSKKIKKLEKEFLASKFYKQWKRSTTKPINMNSNDQLGKFLYGVKKIIPAKLTKTGKGSTDEESLHLLKIPELDIFLKRKQLQKLRDTYLDAFLREQVDGYIHPFYNLHNVITYRGSSSNPNFQNIPNRDEYARKTCRKAIYPRPGNQILNMDFKGIEVSVAACYHDDPNMIKYITNPKSDMHGDMAEQIFKIDDWDRNRSDHKVLRAAAKNGFVFPQFYGDYYVKNAESICSSWIGLPQCSWEKGQGIKMENGMNIGKHLINKGIKSYTSFIKHLQKIEKDFWKKRFPVYDKWKETQYEIYQNYGYVTFKTGFSYIGVRTKNQVNNSGIQGSAFHCLLWCFIELDKRLTKLKFQTKLVGQIHDDIMLDVYPPELIQVYNLVIQITTVELPKAFTWINVPLSIDAELCPVDGSWAEKKDWKPESNSKQKFRKSLKKSYKECDATEIDIY